MIEELRNLLNNAYAPYSNYRVSAILIDENNNKYTGVNIENASFGATICAERVAITKAVSEGARKFIELNDHIKKEKDLKINDLNIHFIKLGKEQIKDKISTTSDFLLLKVKI